MREPPVDADVDADDDEEEVLLVDLCEYRLRSTGSISF
jgi:hypothetical protein